MTLRLTETHEYFMKGADFYYNEEFEHLVIYDDDMNKVDLGGVTLQSLKALFANIGAAKLRQTKKDKEAA
tara:strand:+ start:57 stop:266 length:210 start_codon:yes stop_codon:yes gene_type:complete